jgi:hypothetical protein
MKQIFLIVSFVFFGVQSYANNDSQRNNVICNSLIENCTENQDKVFKLISELKLHKIENYSIKIIKNENEELYDCEITVKGNFEGNQVDIVVTIYDVSWAGCQTLKAAVKVLLATK